MSAELNIGYSIRRSDRARRVRVAVDPDGAVEVVLPRRARERDAAAAVRELEPWIRRRLAEAAGRAPPSRPAAPRCPTSASRSRSWPSPGARACIAAATGCSSRPATRARRSSAGSAAGPPRRDRARVWSAPRRRRACGGRSVRSATSGRAGEVARRPGRLSFNWRLLLAPEEVLDYVVWHEACHLAVLDHSPRFWALLAEPPPDHRRRPRLAARSRRDADPLRLRPSVAAQRLVGALAGAPLDQAAAQGPGLRLGRAVAARSIRRRARSPPRPVTSRRAAGDLRRAGRSYARGRVRRRRGALARARPRAGRSCRRPPRARSSRRAVSRRRARRRRPAARPLSPAPRR